MSMNLKYNRMDMKKSLGEKSKVLPMKRKPLSSKNQRPCGPTKPKQKQRQPKRAFGTDITNCPPSQEMNEQSILVGPEFPCAVEPYLASILAHMQRLDEAYVTRLELQMSYGGELGVNAQMRTVLLRWLLQVGKKFQLQQQTIHICVQIIDFMIVHSGSGVNKHNLQLLGVASLFVASKYHEIHTWEAQKYIFVCDGLYSMEQLFEMEGLILTATGFNLQFPTIHQFAGPALMGVRDRLTPTVHILADLSLFDFTLFNRFQKRHLASVILYLALKLDDPDNVHSKDIMKQCDVPEGIFKECWRLLLNLYKQRLANSQI